MDSGDQTPPSSPAPGEASAAGDLKRRFRRLFDHAPDGILRTSPDGRLLAANPAMVRMLGHATEAAAVAHYTDLAAQLYVDPARRAQFVRRLRVTGQVEQFEAEFRRADGRPFWVSCTAWTELDSAGRIRWIDAAVRDVTAQRQAEADRARCEAEARRLALVVGRVRDPIAVTDADGRVEWANAALLALAGQATTADVTGRTLADLLGGPRADLTGLDALRANAAAGRPATAEVLACGRGGRACWLSVAVEPVRDESGVVRQFVATLDDVTDRKRAHWLEQDRRLVLERVARHEPVDGTLASICRAVSRQGEGAAVAVLRHGPATRAVADACSDQLEPLTSARRWAAAAHGLSAALVAAIDRSLSGDPAACPFTAGDATAPVESVVADVSADPRWAGLSAAAAAEGVTTCRSVPIVAGDGSLLGELVVLHGPTHGMPRTASDDGFGRAIAGAAGLAALAIEHGRLADQLACQATQDPLTGLPNRARLDAILPGWLAAAARGGRPLGVLMVDLDGFKHVNDTLGHAAGDALLAQVARRLSAAARDGDVLVRMGGDEFALVATDLAAAADVAVVARRLIGGLATPFTVEGRELFVTASVGTAAYPADGGDAGALVRNADAALHAAKAAGRNRAAGFDASMNVAACQRLDLEGRMRRVAAAIARDGNTGGEMSLAYQPQVDPSGRVTGVEALLRWDDPRGGRVSPAQFIPVAEASGLIVPVGTWVLREACRQAAAWRAQGVRPVPVCVNVSVLQFAQADFTAVVAAALADHSLDPRWLELELTESVLMANTADAVAKLTALQARGVGTAIDDFGTGYSSLAYLRRLPIDRLKIDQSFVRDLVGDLDGTRDGIDTAVIKAVAGLASTLGMSTVAEGVETAAQRDCLRRLGCETFQGYLYSPAVPPDGAALLIRDGCRPAAAVAPAIAA